MDCNRFHLADAPFDDGIRLVSIRLLLKGMKQCPFEIVCLTMLRSAKKRNVLKRFIPIVQLLRMISLINVFNRVCYAYDISHHIKEDQTNTKKNIIQIIVFVFFNS